MNRTSSLTNPPDLLFQENKVGVGRVAPHGVVVESEKLVHHTELIPLFFHLLVVSLLRIVHLPFISSVRKGEKERKRKRKEKERMR